MQNSDHSHNILDTSRIGTLLMKLTAPMFFGMVIQNIYQIVDTIFVGRYVGTDALAALSVTMPIQMFVFGAGNMVSIGGASLISRLIGQRDKQMAERTLGNSIFFSAVFSLIVTIIIVPFPGFWLKLVGVSDNVMPYAREYLTIIMSGSVFNLCGAVLLALVRAEGNARVSMISMIIQSVLNVSLDAVFIIGLKMGIGGAGLAMVISQGVALIYVLSYYLMGESYLTIRWRNFFPDKKVVKNIFAIGVSQFFKTVVDSVSATMIIKMVGHYGGDIGLSTFSILIRVMNFASLPGNVFSQAMQPILGFNYGAKRFRQALKAIYYPAFAATALGIVALLVLVIFPSPIIRLFTADAALIDSAVYGSHIMFLGLAVFGFFIVGQMVFPAIGKAMSTFLVSVLRPLLLILPAALLLPRFFGVAGVWLIFPITDTASCLLVLGFLIPLLKRFHKAAREQEAGISLLAPNKDHLNTPASHGNIE
jgi:putative MATE family efflux protein